jgi:hypothetical protein
VDTTTLLVILIVVLILFVRLVRQGALVLGLVSAAAHTAGSDILGGSQRAAPAGVRPDCNVLDRAPRVRANNSSKAIFVTAMWAASIDSISSFGRTLR